MSELFPGFQKRMVAGADGVEIRAFVGGSGPPLLLLHGYPQTAAIWHRVAPRLARHFTVVATDLRGYGFSSKPASSPDHATYSKRAMALDQVNVMEALGFREFFLAGHDRGGRVAHRLALDHPGVVKRLAVLDIAPTRDMYLLTDRTFAEAYYHWFFLIQSAPFPERLIGADPAFFLQKKLGSLGGGHSSAGIFAPAALAEYAECFARPETISATCEDYRAAATIDLAHDEADLERKIRCPLLVLWGARGTVAKCFHPLTLWQERVADSIEGEALPAGHYLAEECPDLVAGRFEEFFGKGTSR